MGVNCVTFLSSATLGKDGSCGRGRMGAKGKLAPSLQCPAESGRTPAGLVDELVHVMLNIERRRWASVSQMIESPVKHVYRQCALLQGQVTESPGKKPTVQCGRCRDPQAQTMPRPFEEDGASQVVLDGIREASCTSKEALIRPRPKGSHTGVCYPSVKDGTEGGGDNPGIAQAS